MTSVRAGAIDILQANAVIWQVISDDAIAMLKFHPKIFTKGLILISVPLLFEFAFLFTYFQVQEHYDSVLAKESEAREIIYHANEIYMLLVDAWFQRIGEALFAIPDKSSKESLSKMEGEYAILQNLIVGRGSVREHLQHMRRTTIESITLTEKFVKPASGVDFNQMMALENNLKLFEELQANSVAFGVDMEKFREQEDLRDTAIPQEIVEVRLQIQQILGLGVLFSIVLPVGLFVFFISGINQNIQVLLTNTKRFSAGEELLLPVKGNDELAELDRMFHQMAADLKTAMRRERASINNAADMICVLDSSYKINFVNPAAEKTLAISADELSGKSFLDLLAEGDKTVLLARLSEFKENNEHGSFELNLELAEHKYIPCVLTAQWSAQEEEFFCMLHDISRQKQLDEQRKAFSAQISEELRKPLSLIQSFLFSISSSDEQLSPRAMKGAKAAFENCNWLLKLMDDLIDAGKREAASIGIVRQVLSVDSLVQKALASVAAIAERKGVSIEAQLMEFEDWLDPDRILQVLMNLLSNALKFSPQGGQIIVSLEEKDEQFELRVKDSGPGISEADKKKLFSAYSQLENQGVKQAGTGLGLVVCKEIIELHGGILGVESQVGAGATFWFRLPKSQGGIDGKI